MQTPVAIAIGLISLIWMLGASWADETRPLALKLVQSSLTPEAVQLVAFRPGTNSFVAIMKNVGDFKETQLGLYDINADFSIAEKQKLSLPLGVASLLFSESGDKLYLLSEGDIETVVARLAFGPQNTMEGSAKTVHLKNPVGRNAGVRKAAMAVDCSARLYVTSPFSPSILSFPLSTFDSQNLNDPAVNSISTDLAGIRSIFIASDRHIAFVSAEGSADVEAFALPGGCVADHPAQQRVLDKYSVGGGSDGVKSAARIPLALDVNYVGKIDSRSPSLPSLIVADYQRDIVVLLTYESSFETLRANLAFELKSSVEKGALVELDPKTGLLAQPYLLDSSTDHKAVVLGNAYSRTLTQFARGKTRGGKGVLEKIFSIILPETPTALAVSTDGALAVVAMGKKLAVLSNAGVPDAEDAQKQKIRDIQLELVDLGLAVDVVDGIAGEKTLHSIDVFQSVTGMKVDASNLDELLGAVRSVKNGCNTRGLSCLKVK